MLDPRGLIILMEDLDHEIRRPYNQIVSLQASEAKAHLALRSTFENLAAVIAGLSGDVALLVQEARAGVDRGNRDIARSDEAVNGFRRGLDFSRGVLARAVGAVSQCTVELNAARAERNRAEVAYDAAQSQYRAAQAAYDRASDALRRAESALSSCRAQIRTDSEGNTIYPNCSWEAGAVSRASGECAAAGNACDAAFARMQLAQDRLAQARAHEQRCLNRLEVAEQARGEALQSEQIALGGLREGEQAATAARRAHHLAGSRLSHARMADEAIETARVGMAAAIADIDAVKPMVSDLKALCEKAGDILRAAQRGLAERIEILRAFDRGAGL